MRRGLMSASLIGRLWSSAFRPSTTAVLMSLAGSCFSTESAHRPFHHGIRRRGGTIFRAACRRQVQADIPFTRPTKRGLTICFIVDGAPLYVLKLLSGEIFHKIDPGYATDFASMKRVTFGAAPAMGSIASIRKVICSGKCLCRIESRTLPSEGLAKTDYL
jgi:hypothetical protein